MTDPTPRIRLRLYFGDFTLGPGKAELLEKIAETGSISAAGRAMGMSYKRAWMLIEAMNEAFRQPVIDSARGGAGGGGAVLTETGHAVLAQYRALQATVLDRGADQIAGLQSLLRDMSDQK